MDILINVSDYTHMLSVALNRKKKKKKDPEKIFSDIAFWRYCSLLLTNQELTSENYGEKVQGKKKKKKSKYSLTQSDAKP